MFGEYDSKNEFKMNIYDARLKSNSSFIFSGPSKSGKTTLVEKIIAKRDDLFTEPFSCIQWFCAYPPKIKLDGVTYRIGLPLNQLNDIPPHSLIILDDFMSELSQTSDLTKLMTKAVHHLPMTLIYITQNLFQQGKDVKTRRMNTDYLVLFKNPHDRAQVDYIGRQMYPKDTKFLTNVYTDVTAQEAYSYLFIDFRQETSDEIRIRSHITDNVVRVYTPNSLPLTI